MEHQAVEPEDELDYGSEGGDITAELDEANPTTPTEVPAISNPEAVPYTPPVDDAASDSPSVEVISQEEVDLSRSQESSDAHSSVEVIDQNDLDEATSDVMRSADSNDLCDLESRGDPEEQGDSGKVRTTVFLRKDVGGGALH